MTINSNENAQRTHNKILMNENDTSSAAAAAAAERAFVLFNFHNFSSSLCCYNLCALGMRKAMQRFDLANSLLLLLL